MNLYKLLFDVSESTAITISAVALTSCFWLFIIYILLKRIEIKVRIARESVDAANSLARQQGEALARSTKMNREWSQLWDATKKKLMVDDDSK